MQGGRLSTRPPLAPEGLSLEDFIAVHVLVADCVDFLGPTHHLTGPLNDLAIKARDLLLFSHTVSTGTSRVEVVVIGEFSSGKSSFVNSLLGEVLCPVDVTPTTSSVTRFAFDREIRIVDEITGAAVRPEDYADLARHPPEGGAPSGGARRFTYYGPFPELQSVAVTDTPGFDNPDAPDDAKVTHDAAAQADVVIFVFDAQRGEVSGATEAILDELRTRRPETPWIAVVNRADTRTPKDLARIVENLRTKHGPRFTSVVAYSSLQALHTRNLELESALRSAHDDALTRIAARAHFDLRLNAASEESGYVVHVQERSFPLGARTRQDIRSARDIRHLLKEHLGRKVTLVRKRLSASVVDHRRSRDKTFKSALRVLGAMSSADSNAVSSQPVREAFESAILAIADSAERSYRGGWKAALWTRDLRNQERSWGFLPYVGVVWSEQSAQRFVEADGTSRVCHSWLSVAVGALLSSLGARGREGNAQRGHEATIDAQQLPQALQDLVRFTPSRCRQAAEGALRREIEDIRCAKDEKLAPDIIWVGDGESDASVRCQMIVKAFPAERIRKAYGAPLYDLLSQLDTWAAVEPARRAERRDAGDARRRKLSDRIDRFVRGMP